MGNRRRVRRAPGLLTQPAFVCSFVKSRRNSRQYRKVTAPLSRHLHIELRAFEWLIRYVHESLVWPVDISDGHQRQRDQQREGEYLKSVQGGAFRSEHATRHDR